MSLDIAIHLIEILECLQFYQIPESLVLMYSNYFQGVSSKVAKCKTCGLGL